MAHWPNNSPTGPPRISWVRHRRWALDARRYEFLTRPLSFWEMVVAVSLVFALLFIAASGIFSPEMEEEVERAQHAPIPSAEEIAELLSGRASPPVPGWHDSSPGDRTRPKQKSDANEKP